MQIALDKATVEGCGTPNIILDFVNIPQCSQIIYWELLHAHPHFPIYKFYNFSLFPDTICVRLGNIAMHRCGVVGNTRKYIALENYRIGDNFVLFTKNISLKFADIDIVVETTV